MSDPKIDPKDYLLSQESIDALTELAELVRRIQNEQKTTMLPWDLVKDMLPEQEGKKRGRPRKKSVAELKGRNNRSASSPV